MFLNGKPCDPRWGSAKIQSLQGPIPQRYLQTCGERSPNPECLLLLFSRLLRLLGALFPPKHTHISQETSTPTEIALNDGSRQARPVVELLRQTGEEL